MSENQVFWIAKQVVVRKGFRLKDYLTPAAAFDAKKKEWMVFFDHKPPGFPGSHFTVSVDDSNGKAFFWEGM